MVSDQISKQDGACAIGFSMIKTVSTSTEDILIDEIRIDENDSIRGDINSIGNNNPSERHSSEETCNGKLTGKIVIDLIEETSESEMEDQSLDSDIVPNNNTSQNIRRNDMVSDQISHEFEINNNVKICKSDVFRRKNSFSIENDYEVLTHENIELNVENSILRREVSNLSFQIVRRPKVYKYNNFL
jgi:hypothetical protein